MAPKKKQPHNAFYFYMLERKVHYERNGEHFPNGLKDVAEVVGPEWANLPPSAKKKFEEMAKQEKERQKGDTGRKYTNQHNSFDYMDKNREEKEQEKQKMNKHIETMVSSLCSTKKIAEAKFYLIHINYFCITEGECYHPAELAVAEFSLAEGVTDVYHCIINSGQIPLGYRHDAMQKSQSVHHIPLEPEEGQKSLQMMWRNVKALLERGRSTHGGAYPPLYTMPDNVNLNTSFTCVKSVVTTLCESVGDNPEDFQIYALEKLFFELKNSCAHSSGLGDDDGKSLFWPSMPFACSKLEDDIYNYTPHIACSFHYKEDHVVNCSKSFVQRWAYLICDECCQYLNIQMIPGKHVPKDSDVNFKLQYERREEERKAEAAAKLAPKPFHLINHAAGKPTSTTFIPVEIQHPPLPQPRLQPSISTLIQRSQPVYEDIDTSEENFPAIPVGRGRGRITPRAPVGGRGSGPMSFAAATQSKKH